MTSPRQSTGKAQHEVSPSSAFLSRVLEVSRNGESPLNDDVIWKRLREAGFDEESIKKRDKASLIAYITKLESEIYEYQHHLGLVLLERKEWMAKYEQAKSSANSAEATYRCDQSAHLFALAEARKREESLKKALGVEKLCVANIEKTLHEMRAEYAETKLASEGKLAEARTMMENAEKQFFEAEAKLHAAEALQAEASRYHNSAERKLQEVEAREDGLRRQMAAFKSECDAKEKEISLERQCIFDLQKTLRQGQERLLEGQSLLNQREESILERSEKLSRLEKELEAEIVRIDESRKLLDEEKADFELKMASLASREEDVIKRETLLDKREQDILVLQETITSRERDEVQRLIAEHEAATEIRRAKFEAELDLKGKLLEDEIENKRQACELKEADLNEKEEDLQRRVHDIERLSIALVDKENVLAQKMKSLEERTQNLNAMEEDLEVKKMSMLKEKEEIAFEKLDLQKQKDLLEDEKRQLILEQQKLEVTQSEREDLLVLQTKLKEEIDGIRAEKLKVEAENDDLRAEKEKFENEWQIIDEKREELQKEAERVAEERKAVSKFLKDEFESLKLEKDAIRDQFKQNVESLDCEREAFMRKMEHEHAEWFSKIQKERADFLREIDLQKNELESCAKKKQEEIERVLREREQAFEQEKAKELQNINFQKDLVAKELEIVATEMKRLENERKEIALDREQREKEWLEIKTFIEELQTQREKLQEQRELLHTEREDIQVQIQQLKDLGELKVALENGVLSDAWKQDANCSKDNHQPDNIINAHTPVRAIDEERNLVEVVEVRSRTGLLHKEASDNVSPNISSPLSWLKKCADRIFKASPEKGYDDLVVSTQFNGSQGTSKIDKPKPKARARHKEFRGKQPVDSVLDEAKVIYEVPSFPQNVNGGNDLENETNTSNKKLVQCKESHAQKRERSVSTNSGRNASFAGRKRQNSFPSNDAVDASNHKQKKTRQRRDVSEALEEEKSPNWKVSAQKITSKDQLCEQSFNQTDEDNNSCADESYGVLETHSNVKDANTSSEQLIRLQDGASDLHNGRQVGLNGHQVSCAVENDGSAPVSHRSTQKQAFRKDCLVLGKERAEEYNESLGEVIAESGNGLNHGSESKQDVSDGEVDDDDGEHTTAKEKIWNFLIT